MSDLVADYYNRGNTLVGQRRYDEAVALYEAAVALKPDAAEVHSNLGLALAAQNQHERACGHFRKALAARPSFANAHSGLAKSLTALNRPLEAVKHYEKVISLNPAHSAARHNLGMLLNSLGYHDKAAAQFRKLVKTNPDNPAVHNNLGTALHALGRLEEAIPHFRTATRLKPELVVGHVNLGNSLAGLGRDEDALTSYSAALALDPRCLEGLCRRADVLGRLDRKEEAIADYEAAIAVAPGLVEAHNNLGSLLTGLRRFDEAIARFQKALALDSNCVPAHINLGVSLQALGRLTEAMVHYNQALRLSPTSADAHTGRGSVLLELGRIGEARQAFETALELAPRHTGAYHLLIETKRFSPDDEHLAAMEKIAKSMSGLRANERIELHFALGKALADAGRYDGSGDHFAAGNSLKRSMTTYDEESTLEFLAHMREKFGAEAIEGLRGAGHPSAAPVFIVGMPRSGTTLVEQILARHPRVFAAGELRVVAESMKAISGMAAALDSPEPGIDPVVLRDLGSRYISRIRALAPDAARVTDKMPANFRFLGLIHLALPNARIIHVRRNPVDTCLSCFSKLFAYDLRFCYDLGELGRYYRAYHALMQHWTAVLPESTVLEVNYEDVVGDLEGQVRRLLAHCELEWDAACLDFHRATRPVRTASAAQVRQPIYRTSIGRWRAYGTAIAPLLDALGPELTADA